MAKYLIQGTLSMSGTEGVIKDGGSRRNLVIKQAVESMGGQLEAFYFAFGTTDVLAIVDMPSNVSTAALSLAIGASGAVADLTTTVLLAPTEIDEAVAMHPDYTPPGDPGGAGR